MANGHKALILFGTTANNAQSRLDLIAHGGSKVGAQFGRARFGELAGGVTECKESQGSQSGCRLDSRRR